MGIEFSTGPPKEAQAMAPHRDTLIPVGAPARYCMRDRDATRVFRAEYSHPGRSVGWVVADSDSAVPQGIKPGAWQISDGHQWYRDSRIGVTCADFCEHLVVAGQAGLAQSRLMGNYFLYEKRAHGRPIYQFSDKKHYLYFHESTQLQQHEDKLSDLAAGRMSLTRRTRIMNSA